VKCSCRVHAGVQHPNRAMCALMPNTEHRSAGRVHRQVELPGWERATTRQLQNQSIRRDAAGSPAACSSSAAEAQTLSATRRPAAAARWGRTARRSVCSGLLLMMAVVLEPGATAAEHAAPGAGGHARTAALAESAAQMRLRLRDVTKSQDAALSKAEQFLSTPIDYGSDTGADAKAPPTPAFLKAGNAGLQFAEGTKLVGAKQAGAKQAAPRRWNVLNREEDRRRVRARLGRETDERPSVRSGPGAAARAVNARELAQERRDRSSERRRAGLGSEKRALEEAAAFARLTAGARDPRAAAKKRLAQKYEHESYERASNEGQIWKEINQMKHHAEDDTVRIDTSDGLSGEVRALANLSPPKAAEALAKMSQTDGSAALGALKSIDPEQVNRILAALGEQEQQQAQQTKHGVAEHRPNSSEAAGSRHAPGAAAGDKQGGGGKQALVPRAPPPQFNINTVDRFDPGESLSFAGGSDGGTFSMSYADTSVITGYVCKDIVQLGHYYAMTRFGCAVDCNDPHFNGVDGILGTMRSSPPLPLPLLPLDGCFQPLDRST
jgi:hypothetical protein